MVKSSFMSHMSHLQRDDWLLNEEEAGDQKRERERNEPVAEKCVFGKDWMLYNLVHIRNSVSFWNSVRKHCEKGS